MLLSFRPSACMNCTKVLIVVGLTFIMILFNIKKYCVLNMAVMEKKQRVKMHKIRCMHFLHTWRRMVCCFIPAVCSLKNIRMEHSLHFTDHGIVLLNHRKDISLHSFRSKMESQVERSKYSQIILQEKKMCNRAQQSIVPAV